MIELTKFNPDKTIFVIDGSSFLYRAYYGLRPIHTSGGVPVQAVYNFCRMIRKMIDQYHPHYLVIAWDSKGATERHEMFPAYKATRQEPPSDLFEQKRKIVEFADLIGVKQLAQSGVEADDLMYAVTKDLKKNNTVVLITSDKDMGQLLDGNVVMLDWFKDELLDAAALEQKLGFSVAKIPFFYALIGDSSDNIPGVKGIGKVGATELVNQFDSLKDLYANLDKVKKPRTRAALEEHKDDAFLSEQLFLLRYHDLKLTKEDLSFDEQKWPNAQPLFEELEFKSLLKDLEKYGVVRVQEKLSEQKGYNFVTITDEAALHDVVQKIKAQKSFALDTETDALNALNCNLVGISISVEAGVAYYIPCGHVTIEKQLTREEVLAVLKPVFEDATIKKYLQHTKFDELVLSQYGVAVRGVTFDTMVAAHLVTEDWQRVGLKYLSKYYLKEDMLTFSDAVTKNGYKNFSELPLNLATEYAAADAHQTLRLVPILEKALKDQHMEKLFYDIEFPLISVLFAMEKEGIHLDVGVIHQLNDLVMKDLAQIEKKILAAVGEKYKSLNLNSPKQLEQLLFVDLGLPTKKKTKTGFSTDQEVLEELAPIHPVPGLIIRYRELFKLKSTYLDALPTYVNPKDGKIHTTFSQTSVATGRLSSSEPNLQNVPVHTRPYDIHVRTAFEPEKGHLFLSADYSQIELRVLAFLSGDTGLTDAFLQGIDIHTQTASKLFDVPLAQVTHEQRQLGKRINFSILYGLTPYGLSKDLGISFNDAKLYIDKYFAQYPQVSAWMAQVIEDTKQHGYVTTYWGRRRYVPGIYEHNKNLYDLACRIAVNTKAQGTAAELMKLGMINLNKALKQRIPEAKIILQIHDELLISVPKDKLGEASALTKDLLEKVVSWPIPLVVDVRSGSTWQEVTK
jgi:DNA polymerase-1